MEAIRDNDELGEAVVFEVDSDGTEPATRAAPKIHALPFSHHERAVTRYQGNGTMGCPHVCSAPLANFHPRTRLRWIQLIN